MSESNGAAMNGHSNGTTTNGRDVSGRFSAGNKGGPGNPFARQTAALRKAIQNAVSEEDLAAIATVLKQKALQGDIAAAKLVFSYAAGKPGPTADPDTLDAHELAVRRGNTASLEDMKALFESCPAALLCAIAAVVAPQVQAHLEKTFAQGVRRQDECEKQGRKVAPDAPGPYPGRKVDWAPDWLKEGLPPDLTELFESCPAWMPNVMGKDRPLHSLGDMLRSVRRSLLDTLKGSEADQRHSVTSADSKREKPGELNGSAPSCRPLDDLSNSHWSGNRP